ncbi:hypothetical protein [Pseudarthrobacter sp. NPDC058119]|uniref:hypothetical protein n=1 Tax=Pseudarthrobacter sp. NPDC058119 TaxID=3346348 RepID=UPI0036DEF7D0
MAAWGRAARGSGATARTAATERSTATARSRGRRAGALAAALLALAGCSPAGTPPPSNSPASDFPPASTAPATGSPSGPFSDAELAAIINGVGRSRNLPYPTAQDSTRLRSGAASGSFPQTRTETTPADCVALVPGSPFTHWADTGINFADGAMPPAGGESGPTTTIGIILRSAEKESIARADFGYQDDLLSRCGQFDLAYTEAGRTSTYALQLLAAPPIADKQHAFMQVTKPRGAGDFGSVGLRVLDGTLSITLTLSVATLNSEADARPALASMADLAKELISEAGKPQAPAAPGAPNSMAPDQMVALFKGMTGPGGAPVSLPQARIVGLPQGSTPTAPPSPADSPCTFDDQAYTASLAGSVSGQGQIQGATKMDYTDLTVVNMPSTMQPPYPFDTRVDRLRGCTSVLEILFEGGSRTWSPVAGLDTGITADSSYAVAYQLSDGTGQWHVRCGARRGTLSIEAGSGTASQAEAQAKAGELASFFNAVFSRAGK